MYKYHYEILITLFTMLMHKNNLEILSKLLIILMHKYHYEILTKKFTILIHKKQCEILSKLLLS